MAISISTAARNARLQAITDALGSNCVLRIYAGTPPANVNAALSSNTQLAELVCSATFAPSPSGGVLTASAITQDSSADATGTATFFRLLTSGGTAVIQGTVATSGGDATIVSTSITAGGPVQCGSFVLTEANV